MHCQCRGPLYWRDPRRGPHSSLICDLLLEGRKRRESFLVCLPFCMQGSVRHCPVMAGVMRRLRSGQAFVISREAGLVLFSINFFEKCQPVTI